MSGVRACIRLRWPLKVLRLADKLCSSPMSARTYTRHAARSDAASSQPFHPALPPSIVTPGPLLPPNSLPADYRETGSSTDCTVGHLGEGGEAHGTHSRDR